MGEIEQVFFNIVRIGRNRRNRAAAFSVEGLTDGGRRVRVNFDYDADTRTAIAISAWEVR
ncbi:hypothetical protein [Saccharopolyspora dendranthemae]|uniref:hypothetical protein n=1 Tax=Saccharopolyspora dendranthemae TaxID=1181886 RepID=UPI00119F8794|nr:hypothetical protein [Saccharopolyspora dendranthemae]